MESRGWYVRYLRQLDADTALRFDMERGRLRLQPQDGDTCVNTGLPVGDCYCGQCDERE